MDMEEVPLMSMAGLVPWAWEDQLEGNLLQLENEGGKCRYHWKAVFQAAAAAAVGIQLPKVKVPEPLLLLASSSPCVNQLASR